eukprot:CAMPEP_0197880742 /NCGR_PEP_ID=MMETSP1439-20131203/8442_1 /TAXON_ID=66791 /ORGANISM="Gonyaulax spinifera, Strain CCMP409" /LENGTH=52 /DNA_ID=CAMNT_0043500305 /DNA_START=19 /DNA_END=174 /DNA_ORIENTATION=-
MNSYEYMVCEGADVDDPWGAKHPDGGVGSERKPAAGPRSARDRPAATASCLP